VQGTVALDDASGPLGFPDARTVDLAVTQRGRVLGKVHLPVFDGVVGEDRWRHAVATAFRPDLLGVDDDSARAAISDLFVHARR
jgi:hypothetical protein